MNSGSSQQESMRGAWLEAREFDLDLPASFDTRLHLDVGEPVSRTRSACFVEISH